MKTKLVNEIMQIYNRHYNSTNKIIKSFFIYHNVGEFTIYSKYLFSTNVTTEKSFKRLNKLILNKNSPIWNWDYQPLEMLLHNLSQKLLQDLLILLSNPYDYNLMKPYFPLMFDDRELNLPRDKQQNYVIYSICRIDKTIK